MLFAGIKPMLLSLTKKADLRQENYIYEPKYDGYRLLLHKDGNRVELYTRNGNQMTDRLPEIVEAGRCIKANKAILDGEGVVFRGGRPVFDDFAYRGRLSDPIKIKSAQTTHPATFIAFDVINNGADLTGKPLYERKERLAELVEPNDHLLTTLYVKGEGNKLFNWTKENDWEGIVYKHFDSKYQFNIRNNKWIKAKHWKSIDTVILGYKFDPFALIVGAHFRTVKNKPIATVEWGLTSEMKQAFIRVANGIHTTKSRNGVQWIEPLICCRVKYLERTDSHNLRHAIFQEFLCDDSPRLKAGASQIIGDRNLSPP